VLLIEEAGGRACRLDGTAYQPAQTANGLLIAADEQAWTTVRDNLLDSTQQPMA
jgi:fructose-1,6-bisphosphatase/inositol monophosphatase family enzyme